MENSTCPLCGSPLSFFSGKLVCTNANCTYAEISKITPWYSELSKNNELWNQKVITNGPSIIAYEYDSLRELLKHGEVYGVPIKIKDIFESTIKFWVLIILSRTLSEENNNGVYNDILFKLTNKEASFGDWCDAANDILKKDYDRHDHMFIILKDINDLCNKNKIVTWRNDTTGHGALTPGESELFQETMISFTKLLALHFNKYADSYCKLQLLAKHGNDCIYLTGSKKARNLKLSKSDLFIEYENTTIPIFPLIQYIEGGIYFYDSYKSHRDITCFLDYPNGKREKKNDIIISKIYKKICKGRDIATLGSANVDRKIYNEELTEAIERIKKPERLIKLSFLTKAVENIVADDDKGIYLLQMNSGMGKTTFVKMLDNLAYNKIKMKDTICRAFYINPIYSYKPYKFVQGLEDCLRETNSHKHLSGDFPNINVKGPHAKEEVANYINAVMTYYKENVNCRMKLNTKTK